MMAECTNGTLVLLTGEPHEMQNVLQDSLPLTLRLPIEGEPNACKQEVTDGVIMAECMKGMVKTAEPTETITDVDEGTTLGRGPVLEACGIDEGDRECNSQLQPQQRNLYDEESHQHDENAIADVPNAYGLLLVGEWEVCASGRLSCESGTSEQVSAGKLETHVKCYQQLCMASGNGDCEVECVDTPHELMQLQAMSIELEDPYSGSIPCIHLGSMNWCAGSANSPGCETDGLRGQVDGRRGWTDTLSVSHSAETTGMSNSEGAGTYLGAGGMNHVINTTNGIRCHADALTGPTDVPSIDTDAITPANATQTISTPQKRAKPPDLPIETTRWVPGKPNGHRSHADTSSTRTHASCVGNDVKTAANAMETVKTSRNKQKLLNSPNGTTKWTPDMPNGSGSHMDALSVHMDMHCIGNTMEMAENTTKNVRTCTKESETRNSPNGISITTAKPTSRWRRVSVDSGDVYVPLNVPIVVPSQNFVFGRPESGDEAIAPSVEGERAGDGDGGGYRDVGDVDSMTSGGDIDSKQVEAVLLATDSQHMRQSRRLQRNDLPVSSRPPIHHEEHPYRLVRH